MVSAGRTWQAGLIGLVLASLAWAQPTLGLNGAVKLDPAEFVGSAQSLSFAPLIFYSAALSTDDKWIAGGTSDWTQPGELLLWDAATRQLRLRQRFPLGVRAVAFSPDNSLLAAGTFNNEIAVVDIQRATIVARWGAHRAAVNGLAFSPDGKLLASGSLDKTVRLWEVNIPNDPRRGLKRAATLEGHSDWIFTVAFSPDGQTLYSGGREPTVFVWDLAARKEKTAWKDLPAAVESLAVSPSGDTIALGLWNGKTEIRDVKTAKVLKTLTHLENDTFTVSTVSFSREGKQLATSASDGTAKLWDLPEGTLASTIKAHQGRAWAASLTQDSTRLMTAGTDCRLVMWDVKTAKNDFEIRNDAGVMETTSPIVSADWSADRTHFATAHENGSVRVRRGKTAQSLKKVDLGTNMAAVSFSPDGLQLAGAGLDNQAYVWSIGSDMQQTVLAGHSGPLTDATFAADSNSLFTSSTDGTIRQWDVAKGTTSRTCDTGKQEIDSLACDSRGRWLAGGGQAKTILLWDLSKSTATPTHTLKGSSTAITMLTFSPDGRQLASVGRDKSVLLWDLPEGTKVASDLMPRLLTGHTQTALSAAFSPRGTWLATSGVDKSIRIWNTNTATLSQVLNAGVVVHSVSISDGGLSSLASDVVLRTWEGRAPIMFPTTAGRYVKLKALSNHQPDKGDQFASIAELTLYADGAPLPKSGWKLVSVDSQDKGNEGTLAFDNDRATFWHTQWRTKTPLPLPHELIIDLGEPHNLHAFSILARTDDSLNGVIKGYELSVSNDPKQFPEAASKGELQK